MKQMTWGGGVQTVAVLKLFYQGPLDHSCGSQTARGTNHTYGRRCRGTRQVWPIVQWENRNGWGKA